MFIVLAMPWIMSNGLTLGHCLIRDWHSSRIRRSDPFPIHFRVIPRHRNRFLFQFTVHVTCSVEAGHGHQSWWWCHFPDVLYLFASPLHFTRPPFTTLHYSQPTKEPDLSWDKSDTQRNPMSFVKWNIYSRTQGSTPHHPPLHSPPPPLPLDEHLVPFLLLLLLLLL